MSEDSGFIRNKLQKKDEREYAPDFCGSPGKGMLAAEALRNSPGLTPLSFGVHERIRNRMSAGDGFSATEGTENTETMRNSAGLTPLHIKKEPQINADERRCCCIDKGKKHEETEKLGHSSGLSAPLSLRGEFHKRGVI